MRRLSDQLVDLRMRVDRIVNDFSSRNLEAGRVQPRQHPSKPPADTAEERHMCGRSFGWPRELSRRW